MLNETYPHVDVAVRVHGHAVGRDELTGPLALVPSPEARQQVAARERMLTR